MTVKIRSVLNRIVLFFIAAGMVMGLVYSVACDESYETVCGSGGYQNEMSAPALTVRDDLFADSSANADSTRFLTERDRTGRQLLAGPDNTGLVDFKTSGIFFVDLYIFLLYVLPGTSFKHIFYIHLKDGNK